LAFFAAKNYPQGYSGQTEFKHSRMIGSDAKTGIDRRQFAPGAAVDMGMEGLLTGSAHPVDRQSAAHKAGMEPETADARRLSGVPLGEVAGIA
jgi:hypothetical protein